jgi:hypothetical protein
MTLSFQKILYHVCVLIKLIHTTDTRKMKDIVMDQGYPYERYTVTTSIIFLFISSPHFCIVFETRTRVFDN